MGDVLKTSWWMLLIPPAIAAVVVLGHMWDQSRNKGQPRLSAKPPRPAGHIYPIKNILFRLLALIIGISIILLRGMVLIRIASGGVIFEPDVIDDIQTGWVQWKEGIREAVGVVSLVVGIIGFLYGLFILPNGLDSFGEYALAAIGHGLTVALCTWPFFLLGSACLYWFIAIVVIFEPLIACVLGATLIRYAFFRTKKEL